MNEIKQELYDRFVRYVSIDTTSDPTQKTTPTTASQMMFAKMLADEMPSLGFTEVTVLLPPPLPLIRTRRPRWLVFLPIWIR